MKKHKCALCIKNKARRECRVKGEFICSLCCANLRNSGCEGCRYFQAVTEYQSAKIQKPKKKHFIIELNEEVESAVDKALAFVEKGKLNKGRGILEELIKRHPRNHMVNYGLGVVYAFEEQFEKAYLYMENGEWEKAMTGFHACLAINGRHPQSYGNIGLCMAQLGRKAEALSALDTALAIDPEYAPAIVNRTVIENLAEGEKLPPEKLMSVDYYKDFHSKKKSSVKPE